MSWLGDNFKFELFNGKNALSQIVKHPERALLGIPFDELGTKVYNKVLGTNYDPMVNKFGGPTAKEYDQASAAGINTGPAQGAHKVADTIAGIWGLAGAGSALGGMGGAGGAADSVAAGNAAGGFAGDATATGYGGLDAASTQTVGGGSSFNGSGLGSWMKGGMGRLPMSLGQPMGTQQRQAQMTPIWDPSQDARPGSLALSAASMPVPGYMPIASAPLNPYRIGLMGGMNG